MSTELLKNPYANHDYRDSYVLVNSELCILFSIILYQCLKSVGFLEHSKIPVHWQGGI